MTDTAKHASGQTDVRPGPGLTKDGKERRNYPTVQISGRHNEKVEQLRSRLQMTRQEVAELALDLLDRHTEAKTVETKQERAERILRESLGQG
ncbi:MAG: hypothetical protein S0880_07350 [Actinomycetota bacterium]|nr:hypothetical protein [Actinomycetota bacterium]